LNIVLIGFMGCGKTTIGRKLAVRLGYQFIDTDHQIEREQNARVKEIFARFGEVHFRALETDLLKRLTKVNNTIVATGGGILTTAGNLDIIQRIGKSIYLEACVEEIYERISRNDKRPLLQTEDPLKTVIVLLEKRQKHYEQADYRINTGSLKMGHIVSQIIKDL